MLMPVVITGALPSVIRTDTGSYSSTAVGTITFSSRALGEAGRRHIIATMGWFGSITTTGLTVAGVTATLLLSANQLGARSAIYIASVPTGTTGDVVATFSGTNTNLWVGVYAAYNLRSATPVDTATDTQGAAGTIVLDADVASRGVVVGTVTGTGIRGTPTVIGLTDQVIISPNPSTVRSAQYTGTAPETPRTMGWTLNNDASGCLATFR